MPQTDLQKNKAKIIRLHRLIHLCKITSTKSYPFREAYKHTFYHGI